MFGAGSEVRGSRADATVIERIGNRRAVATSYDLAAALLQNTVACERLKHTEGTYSLLWLFFG
jgi:hypothetical protein